MLIIRWWSNDSSGSKAASMLSIETGKSNYNVGEDIEVVVPSGGINLFVTAEREIEFWSNFG